MAYYQRQRPSTDIIYMVHGISKGNRFLCDILRKVSYSPNPRLNQKDSEALAIFKKEVRLQKSNDPSTFFQGSTILVKVVRGDFKPFTREVIAVHILNDEELETGLFKEVGVDVCV